MRYSSPEFQRAFLQIYSICEESALCFLEYGDKQCIMEWLEDVEPELSVDEFAIILKRNSINIFAQAMRHAELAKGCHSLMNEVTNLEMLVVYYNQANAPAPEGFVDNPEVAEVLKENKA